MRGLRQLFGRGSAASDAPVDLMAPAFFADPAPIYADLRARRPVAPVAGGGYLVTRHADVLAALSNPALGNAPSRFSTLNARNAAKYPAAALAARIPPFLDKPEHVPARQALSALYRDVVADAVDWVPDVARKAVFGRGGETVDLLADVARPFACAAMARLLGVKMTPQDVKSATSAFFHLFAPMTDAARFAQVNDGITTARAAMLAASDDPAGFIPRAVAAGMSREQAVDNAYLLLADGVENIEAACVKSAAIVARHGAQSDMQAVTQECLRLSTPAQILPRVAREDVVLADVAIAQGAPVFLALGSANLDPAAHPHPAAFRPGRNDGPLLVFGRGRHACIGAGLAQLQITSFLSAIADQGGITCVDPGPIQYVARFGHRWPDGLRVRFA